MKEHPILLKLSAKPPNAASNVSSRRGSKYVGKKTMSTRDTFSGRANVNCGICIARLNSCAMRLQACWAPLHVLDAANLLSFGQTRAFVHAD